MRLGIIILYQGQKDPLADIFKRGFLDYLDDIEVCLVNNSGAIGPAEHLSKDLEQLQNFNVLNISKSKSINSAIRAGARYMYSQFPFEHLGQITCQDFEEIVEAIKRVNNDHTSILEWNRTRNSNANRRLTQFQRVFPLSQYYSKIHTTS